MSIELLSVVLPVHNQADHIERVVESCIAELAQLPRPTELLLVPNGGRDASKEVCDGLAAKHGSVRLVTCDGSGWGRAVRTGLAAARGDVLCYTNSARTDASDLRRILLYALLCGDAVVKANRKRRDGVLRRLGSLVYNLECRALFDLSYWDINGTPKVFPRSFDQLTRLTRNDNLIDLEFNVVCRRMDYPVVEIPVHAGQRHGGRSTTTLKTAVGLYFLTLGLYFTTRRRGRAE